MYHRKYFITICLFLNFVCVLQFVSCYEEKKFQDLNFKLRKDFSNLEAVEVVIQDANNNSCNCGEKAKNCDYKDGLKICTCERGFTPGNNEICTAMCNDTHKCLNGGTCYNSVCLCPPRTTGSFCEKISVKCENHTWEMKARYRNLMCCCVNNENSTAKCKYDVGNHDAYCECSAKDEVYDGDAQVCKKCNCGETNSWTKCEYVNEVKRCSCSRHFEYNPKTKICEPNYCGEFSKKSEFTWSGEVKCTCYDGYQQWKDKCIKCDCGSEGICELRDGKPVCHFNENTQEVNGKCLKCNCGKYGQCAYDEEGNKVKCLCSDGFAEHEEICKYCYCGDGSICFFNSTGIKTCNCSSGFEDINGFCVDIDECQLPNVCPPMKKCVNKIGSYICVCKNGYRQTSYGCIDIDECSEKNVCVGRENECFNTPGSYECMCKSGFLTIGGTKDSLICEANVAAKVGYVVMSLLFLIIILGLGAILYRIYRSSSF